MDCNKVQPVITPITSSFVKDDISKGSIFSNFYDNFPESYSPQSTKFQFFLIKERLQLQKAYAVSYNLMIEKRENMIIDFERLCFLQLGHLCEI